MKKKNRVFMLSVMMVATCVCLGGLYGLSTGADWAGDVSILQIDAMQPFAPLERPVVRFYHDTHTAAPSGQDCTVCHLGDGFAFVEMPADASGRATMDAWHKACMDCHKDLVKKGEATGPMTCGECHPKGARKLLPEMPATGFYDAYHDFHMDALSGGCELCHHDYDATAGELYYAEGEETACFECHGETADGDTPSVKDASHLSCIKCHLDMAVGPVACGECHQ